MYYRSDIRTFFEKVEIHRGFPTGFSPPLYLFSVKINKHYVFF